MTPLFTRAMLVGLALGLTPLAAAPDLEAHAPDSAVQTVVVVKLGADEAVTNPDADVHAT